jgi:hypothetical protein
VISPAPCSARAGGLVSTTTLNSAALVLGLRKMGLKPPPVVLDPCGGAGQLARVVMALAPGVEGPAKRDRLSRDGLEPLFLGLVACWRSWLWPQERGQASPKGSYCWLVYTSTPRAHDHYGVCAVTRSEAEEALSA